MASTGAHVLETTEHSFRPTRSVEDLLGAYPIDDDIWGETTPSDVSIDTANNEEVMTSSHITKQHTFKLFGSNQRS